LLRFGIGRTRPPRLYVKASALKEVCKASLRYAEGLSLRFFGIRILKSTYITGSEVWRRRGGLEKALQAAKPP
jgi:hypothetical protein